jgi:hypothetical protein
MKTLSFVVVMPLCLAFPAHAANVYTGCAVPPSTLMCCSSQARRRWAQEPRRARRPSTSSASPARLPTLRGLMRIRCERKLSRLRTHCERLRTCFSRKARGLKNIRSHRRSSESPMAPAPRHRAGAVGLGAGASRFRGYRPFARDRAQPRFIVPAIESIRRLPTMSWVNNIVD